MPPASQPSCSIAPGVTVSTTSRRTRPRASFGILDLLADGDPVPGADELPQVLGRGLHRHAGQRHAVAARGQRDLEDPGRELGVLVEHLVEVADPVKQDGLWMLRLHLAPVLEHRRGRRVGGLAAHGGHANVREAGGAYAGPNIRPRRGTPPLPAGASAGRPADRKLRGPHSRAPSCRNRSTSPSSSATSPPPAGSTATILGCREGRSTETWVDFDFFGNQISAHTTGTVTPTQNTGKVEDILVPMPHFGACSSGTSSRRSPAGSAPRACRSSSSPASATRPAGRAGHDVPPRSQRQRPRVQELQAPRARLHRMSWTAG